MDINSIKDSLSTLHAEVSTPEQMRRASFFRISCINAGFSRKRLEEICNWISLSGERSLFKNWADLSKYISEDEEDSWLRVAIFLLTGEEVSNEGAPPTIDKKELLRANYLFKREVVNSLKASLSSTIGNYADHMTDLYPD
jgi:hypothetical protein